MATYRGIVAAFLAIVAKPPAKHRLDQRLPAEIMAFAALTKAHG
jgi:hypothetical protein